MRRTLLLGTALFLAMASASQAAITAEDIVAQYQSAGYQRIEVEVGVTRAKVEAIKDGQKIEVTYDLETGAVLKSETETLPAGADVTPGVEVKTSDDDDLDDSNDDLDDDEEDDHSGHGGGDDDSDDDSDDDHGGDSDDDSDDDSGDDDGDDHGGDRDDD